MIQSDHEVLRGILNLLVSSQGVHISALEGPRIVFVMGDEEHVTRTRAAYTRKRDLLLDVLGRKGLRDAGGPATMYLWIAVPAGETSEEHAARLLGHGVLVAPGSYLGPSGEGYVRYALVPTEEECVRAVAILEDAL